MCACVCVCETECDILKAVIFGMRGGSQRSKKGFSNVIMVRHATPERELMPSLSTSVIYFHSVVSSKYYLRALKIVMLSSAFPMPITSVM